MKLLLFTTALVLAGCRSGRIDIGGDGSGADTGSSDGGTADGGAADGGSGDGGSGDGGSGDCAEVVDQEEGAFLERGVSTPGFIGGCERARHAFAGAAGSNLSVRLDSLEGADSVTVAVTDLLGNVTDASTGYRGGFTLDFPLTRSGEHFFTLVGDDPSQPASYVLTISCDQGCDRKYTRYPLFFMHGAAGTDSFFDLIDYWSGIEEPLVDAGYRIHVGAVDPFQSSEVRAAQWREQIDDLVADGVGRRFNLIGHSQGGIDGRYLATMLDPDHRVASLTTIATPHRGTSLGALLLGELPADGVLATLIDGIVDALAGLYGLDSDQDALAQAIGLGAEAMAEFNKTVPDRSDVYYASWGGQTCQLLDLLCQADHGGEIVDPIFSLTHIAMQLLEGDNDGLVSLESAAWGEWRGVIDADHLDEIGFEPTAPGFDAAEFYLDEAGWLGGKGF